MTYATRQLRDFDTRQADVARILTALGKDGALVLRNLIPLDIVQSFLQDVKHSLFKVRQGSVYSDERIQEFHGLKTRRLTNLVSVSTTFRHDILEQSLVHEICERVFQQSGTYWLGAAELIEVGPGEEAQPLHRDQDEWPIFNQLGPGAPEACLNFLIAFSDFNETNGATRVIPASHLWEDFSDYGDPRDTVGARLRAGDCLLLSGKTVHGAGANMTVDEARIGLVFSLQCSYLTPEEAFPLHVDRELAETLSPRAKSLLGLSSHYATKGTGLWQGINFTPLKPSEFGSTKS